MSKELRIGLDVDGVFADFNTGFKNLLFQQTGERKISLEEEPAVWGWPTHYGYTREQESAAWDAAKNAVDFWAGLRPYPDAFSHLTEFAAMRAAAHAIYFITTRPGTAAHLQTSYWLHENGFPMPQVLIADNAVSKGQLASGLGLDYYIDDRPENCIAVMAANPKTQVRLLDRAYNRHWEYTGRVSTVDQFIQEIATACQVSKA